MTQEPSRIITFRTDDPDHFVDYMADCIAPMAQPPFLKVQSRGRVPFRAEVKMTRLPRLGLFTIRMSNARAFVTAPLGHISIKVPLGGSFETVTHSQTEIFTPGSAHVAHWDSTFDLRTGDGTEGLVANLDKSFVYDYARKLQGGETPKGLRCEPRLSLVTPSGGSFWRYLSFVWGECRRGGEIVWSPLVLTELENVLVALWLYAVMDGPAPDSGRGGEGGYPAYLRRAEDYILAHLADPVSLADMAEVAGVAARTLSKAFRQRHGTGPIGFLKAQRLEAVQRALLAADSSSTTVTDIAMRFGFFHLGQFSADYRKAFQELPSETLRR